MTVARTSRYLARQRRKEALLGLAWGKIYRALQEGDSEGDEYIMRAMFEITQWKKAHGGE